MSNITVPRGPMRGGQSANLTRDPASAAPALRQAGQKLFTSATQARQQFEANELNQARLNITRDVNALRLKYEQTTDPQEIETGWAEAAGALRAQYVDGASNGLKDPIGLTVDTILQSHALPVARHAQGMRVSQAAGQFREFDLMLSNAWANAGPDERNQMIAQGDQMIDADLDAGFISPEEAVQRRQKMRVTALEAEAIYLVDEDPAAFLAADGRFDALGGQTVARHQKAARSNLRQIEAQAARRAEQEIEARNQELDRQINTAADLTNDGFSVRRLNALLDSPEAQGRPAYARLRAAANLMDMNPGIRAMTPQQLRDTHAQLRLTEISEPWEAEQIKLLEGMIEQAELNWADDPHGQAAKVGVDIRPIDMTALAAPSSIDALEARRLHAQNMAQAGYIQEPATAFLSKEERAALRAQIAKDQPFEQREAALRTVILGFGEDALPVLRDMEQSGAVRQAARIMLRNGREGVAFGNLTLQAVLRGEEKLKAKTVTLPPDTSMQATFNEVTGFFYKDDPQRASDIFLAAQAIYAADAEALNPSSGDVEGLADAEAKAFEDALHRAVGGTFDRNGDKLGGLQEVRGVVTELPPGISALSVGAAWDRVIVEAGGRPGGQSKRAAPKETWSLDTLNRAAAGNAKLNLDLGNASDILSRSHLEAVQGAPGYYYIVQPRGEINMIKPATNGQHFIFHLPTLLSMWQ